MSGLWYAYDDNRLAIALGLAASNQTEVMDDNCNGSQAGWKFVTFLQNYQSFYSLNSPQWPQSYGDFCLNRNEQLQDGSHWLGNIAS